MKKQTYIKFAHDISNWYRANKRDLPFRKTNDPYKIFLSEMMLQQTQVQTMLPYYARFIERFPTINDLASATEDDVLTMWQGLGYYRRAKFIHQAAIAVRDQHNGVFPSDLKSIKALKGVGDYTAGAIHSIAFNQPTPAIDGNVMRVMSRVLGIYDPINNTETVRSVKQLVGKMILHENPSDFTQALMELGALVCKQTPVCEVCPVQAKCFAYKHSAQSTLPVKEKLAPKTEHHFITFLVTYKDKVLLQRNPADGLLANMLACPQFEVDTFDEALTLFKHRYSFDVKNIKYVSQIKHVFTHRVWYMHIYQMDATDLNASFYAIDALPHAISRAHQKVLHSYKK